MPTPALEGTYRDKLVDALRFAETNRANARDIALGVKDRVRRELAARYSAIEMLAPRLRAEIEVIADARTGADPRWKLAVSNERWGDDLVTVYSGVVLVHQMDHIIEQNRDALALLREIRDALGTKSSSDLVG